VRVIFRRFHVPIKYERPIRMTERGDVRGLDHELRAHLGTGSGVPCSALARGAYAGFRVACYRAVVHGSPDFSAYLGNGLSLHYHAGQVTMRIVVAPAV
jgi:hypothetical protein